jgi:hypothetical protein
VIGPAHWGCLVVEVGVVDEVAAADAVVDAAVDAAADVVAVAAVDDDVVDAAAADVGW